MRAMTRTSLPFLLILLGVLACAVPGIPQVDQNAAGTAVAETLNAIIQMTQDAGQNVVDISSDTPAPTLTPSATPTFNPIFPTLTASPIPPATLTPTASLTSTPLVAMISVSIPTNCRLGPGKVYKMIGVLQDGYWVQAYARDPTNNYWYIRNPANSADFCWVWGEYASVTGPAYSLPIYTPPPSPTPTYTSTPAPSFNPSYLGLQTCSGSWWADIKLKNNGSVTFRSVSMTLKDTVTSVTKTSIKDGFTDLTGCNSSTKDTLVPGKAVTASAPKFGYDFGGHKINATITLCTGTGLNGYCVTETLTFKP